MSAKHDRVLAALELREPDRVPTMDLMNEFAVNNAIIGKRPRLLGLLMRNQYYCRAMDRVLPLLPLESTAYALDPEWESLAFRGAAAAEKMGYDSAWLTYMPISRSRDSKTVLDVFGRLNDVFIDDEGNIANPVYREGLITSPADWRAWDKRAILRLPEKINRVFSKVFKEYGDKFFIFGFCSYGLFENIWQPMGFERFVVAMRKERDFINRMIRFYADLYCLMVEAVADAGLPGMVYTDDLAFRSGPMLNPRQLEELFGDHYRRIVETAHSAGMKMIVHSCGNVTSLLEWFADCGFDGVHPIEPTAGMTLTEAKELVGDRMCVMGNLDITHILVDATREEVFEAVRQCIADAGRGGGYILAPDHSHPGISAERLRWMVEAAKEYGNYPL